MSEHLVVLQSTSRDRRVEDAHDRLQRSRLHTRAALADMRQEIVAKADLSRMVRARPGLFLALAFFTGFLLAHRR